MVQSKTLLENDKVKIVEMRIAPGELMPMHTHGRYIAYTMNPAKVRFTLPDGTTSEQEFQKGVVRYAEPGVTHSIENIGSTDVINLDIELKD
jgi:quercetin dioxygenase-like cupin family protein